MQGDVLVLEAGTQALKRVVDQRKLELVGAKDTDPDLFTSDGFGIVEVVGTLPEHRRRGLGYALTAEAMHRLRRRGAANASLYVDGHNPTRAYDVQVGWYDRRWETCHKDVSIPYPCNIRTKYCKVFGVNVPCGVLSDSCTKVESVLKRPRRLGSAVRLPMKV